MSFDEIIIICEYLILELLPPWASRGGIVIDGCQFGDQVGGVMRLESRAVFRSMVPLATFKSQIGVELIRVDRNPIEVARSEIMASSRAFDSDARAHRKIAFASSASSACLGFGTDRPDGEGHPASDPVVSSANRRPSHTSHDP